MIGGALAMRFDHLFSLTFPPWLDGCVEGIVRSGIRVLRPGTTSDATVDENRGMLRVFIKGVFVGLVVDISKV